MIAALTAVWGLLAGVTSPRAAIAVAGLLMLTTPLLLPRHASRVDDQPPAPRAARGDTDVMRSSDARP